MMLLCSMSLYGQQAQLQTSVNQSSDILFIENKGQVINENGRPATDVLFVMKQPDFSIFIYKDGLSYQFTKNIGAVPEQLPTALHDLMDDFPLNEKRISTHRVDVKFQSANKNAIVTPMLKNSYTENYFGNADITNIASFEKIVVTNIYSGIDWVLYQLNGKLKYDLVVHPGANVQQIKMEIIAADETVLLNDDHLQIKTTLGEINDAGLLCYTKNTGVHIDSKFELKNNVVQFNIADYDASQTLIIDPSLDWSTYYGGFGEDAVNGMEVDLDGNILITGYTSSSNNIAALGYKNSYLGGTDIAFGALILVVIKEIMEQK
ncbi:MAG: SBBP repeat-containing protein [Bacteroidetes bacterium]|nr:SBBP repeat-containing protein [Bacteroidota bacterium]